MIAATYWAWDGTDEGYYVYAPTSGSYAKADALLFFPAVGLGSSSSYNSVGSGGNYWSSTLGAATENNIAFRLVFNSKNLTVADSQGHRSNGYSIRPVSE